MNFLFVGECRSPRAIMMEVSWQTAQNQPEGCEPLCSRQLFKALRQAGIDPKQQEFTNLWTDEGQLASLPEIRGKIIIALGAKVSNQLEKLGIPHQKIVHPAARGIWRRQEVYNQHK